MTQLNSYQLANR